MSLLLYRYFCKLVKIWPLQWTFLEVMHDIFRSLYVFFNAWVWNLSKDTWWFSFSVWLSTNWFYVWSFGRVGVYVAALLLFIVKCNQKCCWSVILMSQVLLSWPLRDCGIVEVGLRRDTMRKEQAGVVVSRLKRKAWPLLSVPFIEKVGIRHSLCRTACMQTIWGLTQHLILRNQVSPRLHAYAIKCKIFFGLKIALLSQSCNCDLREQARRFFTAKLLSQAEFAWLKKRLVCLSIANKWFGKDKIIKVWNVKYVEGE